MKINNHLLKRVALALTASLLVAGSGAAVAQYVSPVGTWDVVISGRAKGVAFLTFNSDYTISGIEMIAPAGKVDDTSSSDLRYPGGEPGRHPDPNPDSPSTVSSTNVLYGTYDIDGRWTYDANGKIVGFFPEIGSRGSGTNSAGVTNSVNFTAKVTPGKRISLVGSSGIGKVNYRGIPFTSVPDFSGSWLGQTKRGSQTFYELFDASAYDLFSFDIFGTGPTYEFEGVALVSAQKRIGMHTAWTTSDPVVRVVVGSYNPAKSRGDMKGIEDPKLKVRLRISRAPTLD